MKKIISLLAVLFLVAGCAGMHTVVDYDPVADFSNLKTYHWMPQPPPKTGDPHIDGNTLLAKRIRKAINNVLAEKGYVPSETEHPDFLVGYHYSLEEKMDVETVNDYYGCYTAPTFVVDREGRRRYIGRRRRYRHPYIIETPYTEGTLIIDVADPSTKNLIWRGYTSARVEEYGSPEDRQKRIMRQVEDILVKFPPKEEIMKNTT